MATLRETAWAAPMTFDEDCAAAITSHLRQENETSLSRAYDQAIMNLVSNAIDASEDEGQISITTGGDEGHFVIAVAARGHGIPDELRARVLEPFFTTKPVGVGTGLGLSITYSIGKHTPGRSSFCRATEAAPTRPFAFRLPRRRPAATP